VKSMLRKAAITAEPQAVTSTSPAVTALVGEVAEYVKPAPRAAQPARGQAESGRSTGANAQRKRARRSGTPEHKVAASGRPSALEHKAGAISGRRRDASADARPGRRNSASPRTYSTSTTTAPTGGGNRRTTGRRAQG